MAPTLQEDRAALVRERVLDGVAELLTSGDDLTFARLATVSGVPERTIYRHFPTRRDLLAAVFEWSNRRVGYEGTYPTDADGAVALIRGVFPGFDTVAPVIRELLVDPDGLPVRLAPNPARQKAALGLVRREAPELDRITTRRVAAVVQLLTTAATWQTLRDYWDIDGKEAGETAALAVRLVLAGARAVERKGSR